MSGRNIAAGRKLKCHKKDGVIGAIILYNKRYYALTAYHILKVGKCDLGSTVYLNGYPGKVVKIIWDHDLAVVEINAPETEIEISKISEPLIGPAYSLNENKRINCNIITTGETYHYLLFPMDNIPLPGDSGSPIIQDDSVVGILASVFFNNATGIAVSIKMFNPINRLNNMINK